MFNIYSCYSGGPTVIVMVLIQNRVDLAHCQTGHISAHTTVVLYMPTWPTYNDWKYVVLNRFTYIYRVEGRGVLHAQSTRSIDG